MHQWRQNLAFLLKSIIKNLNTDFHAPSRPNNHCENKLKGVFNISEMLPDVALVAVTGRLNLLCCILIIIMVIIKCYFYREHIALSHEKWCEHRIRKNQQIKSTAHDGKIIHEIIFIIIMVIFKCYFSEEHIEL